MKHVAHPTRCGVVAQRAKRHRVDGSRRNPTTAFEPCPARSWDVSGACSTGFGGDSQELVGARRRART